jgi:hypothetical protein
MTDVLRCFHCQDVIGAYEPVIAVKDKLTRVTSRARDPELAEWADEWYHHACYEERLGESPVPE